ncbi:MAG TPA: endopeptidase La [Candidatus Kapabacteria bacterium]
MAKTTTKKKPAKQLALEPKVELEQSTSQVDLSSIPEPIDVIDVPSRVPVLTLRDVVIFPYMVFPVLVGRESSLSATRAAIAKDQKYIFLVAQKNSASDDPPKEELYRHGTFARVVRVISLPNGLVKVLVDGLEQALVKNYYESDGHIEAEVDIIKTTDLDHKELIALVRHTGDQFREYMRQAPSHPPEVLMSFENMTDPRRKLFYIAAHIAKDLQSKQKVLELTDIREQYLHISALLASEIDILKIEQDIDQKVQNTIQKTQRKYFIYEQMKALQNELDGDALEEHPELGKLALQIKDAKLPEAVQIKADEEIERLKKTPAMSPESGVIRTYLETLVGVPWHKRSADNLNIDTVKSVLEADHYGLEKPKDRILEHIAVLNLVDKMKGQILCLVGPPGVGKTSLARSIAKSLGREFVRISLGGVRDEAEIRGHRRTYIGALPGKIIQSMKRAGVTNPVILLDEIDKMSTDFRGDPSSALLEVLDPEQNHTFNDHYLEVDYDLSNVFFVTTANVKYNIPLPLLDRMEVIELPGYLEHEKLEIAKTHVIKTQLEAHGLPAANVSFTDASILKIIRNYTEEAGVRELVRKIATACRKIARLAVADAYVVKEGAKSKDLSEVIVTEEGKLEGATAPEAEAPPREKLSINPDFKLVVDDKKVVEYLGIEKYQTAKKELDHKVGAVMGLAWTSTGGDVLPVEVLIMSGSEKLSLTGQLGDVMKESAQAALSYIRSRSKELGLKANFMKDKEIHAHFPEGAIPKDGPSAGITMTVAMTSALTGKPVRGDIAMTGEVTLRGNVLPIGGLQEKLLAAQREGIKIVLIPEENRKTLTEIPKQVLKGLNIIPIERIDQAMQIVFDLKTPAEKVALKEKKVTAARKRKN